jgi:two-component system, NarL family, nitrate/nitrite response regulator NarL
MLFHVLEGHTNKVIARDLGLTEVMVKVHLKRFFRKINVDNRTQAAVWALSNLSELNANPSFLEIASAA